MLVVLALGSNQGDRLRYLQEASALIQEQLTASVSVSSVYQTAAWGKEDQADFYNQVICLDIDSLQEPESLLREVLAIERRLGRQRGEKWAARTIDIDILLLGNLVYNSDILTVPHPEIENRRFVLQPLAELLPQHLHPVLQESFNDLLLACKDPLTVKKLEL